MRDHYGIEIWTETSPNLRQSTVWVEFPFVMNLRDLGLFEWSHYDEIYCRCKHIIDDF